VALAQERLVINGITHFFKTPGRWVLLGLLCVTAYFFISIPHALYERAERRMSTRTIMFSMAVNAPVPAGRIKKEMRISGHRAVAQCSARDSDIETYLTTKRQRSPEPRLFCRIDTNIHERDRLLEDFGIIKAMEFPLDWQLREFGGFYGFQGHRTRLRNVWLLAETALWVIVFALAFDLRQDFANAGALLSRRPAMVFLAPFAKVLGLVLGHVVTDYFLAIDLKVTGFIGSMIHAPVVEEILFRAILFTLIAKYSNIWFSALYVSAIFAFDHGYSPASTFGVFTSALALQYLYARYKSVTLCVMAHMLINAAPYFAYLLKLKS
jgi:membrane protease YdiL (CAAX protease family)